MGLDNTLRKTALSSSVDNYTNAWIKRIQKKNATWLKLDKSMTKLASEWVDNRPFALREIENNANAKFLRDNKTEYYGILEKGLSPCELPQASPESIEKYRERKIQTFQCSR